MCRGGGGGGGGGQAEEPAGQVSNVLEPMAMWHPENLVGAFTGADPGFEKGGFYLVPKSDTGGATSAYI